MAKSTLSAACTLTRRAGEKDGIARDMQAQAFRDVPYIPLGQFFYSTAYASDLKGVRDGMTLPLNATRS